MIRKHIKLKGFNGNPLKLRGLAGVASAATIQSEPCLPARCPPFPPLVGLHWSGDDAGSHASQDVGKLGQLRKNARSVPLVKSGLHGQI